MSTVDVYSTISVTGNYDGGNKVYRNLIPIPLDAPKKPDGTKYNDDPVFDVSTTGHLINAKVDDQFKGYVAGSVSVHGSGQAIDCGLTNSERYGYIVVGGKNALLRRITIDWAQHGISGESGVSGDWRNPSYDTWIDDCTVRGMIIDGIKLKQMVRTKVTNCHVDVYPFHPGYRGKTTNYSKSGIYLAGSDTATKDSIMENNEIFQSAPTPTGLANNRAFLTTMDQTTVPSVYSSGNIARNNNIHDVYIGFETRGQNFTMENNPMQNVHTPWLNSGTNPTWAGKNNTYIAGIPRLLTLQSALPQLVWTMNGYSTPNGVYGVADGSIVALRAPKTVTV
jgi:hypothetical protein